MEDAEEFEHLLEIYNKFPVTELIIHPRVQTDYYKYTPRMESFLKALSKSKNPVVYNGDIFNKGRYEQVLKQISDAENVQKNLAEDNSFNSLSENRVPEKEEGEDQCRDLDEAIRNRQLARKEAAVTLERNRGTEVLSKARLWEFHERLLADYTQEMSGERNVLFKMKELWFYLAWSFTNTEKYEKKIRKAQHLTYS